MNMKQQKLGPHMAVAVEGVDLNAADAATHAALLDALHENLVLCVRGQILEPLPFRNAMARWNQTAFESMAAKERARKKIVSAAKRHGIEVDKEDKISKPVTSLRAASTKRGPRGGRKD